MKSHVTFEEVERLIEYIPIEYDNPYQNASAKFAKCTIDSKFYFDDIDCVASRLAMIEVEMPPILIITGDGEEKRLIERIKISFRDIVKLLNKLLKDASIEELVIKERYKQLQQVNIDTSLKGLLFDFCLATLEGDNLNANLYLKHAFYLLSLHRGLYTMLSIIANNSSLRQDKDVKDLLIRIATLTEPNNIDIYFNSDDDRGFNKRYSIYLHELQKST
jgi:hypothetical protein